MFPYLCNNEKSRFFLFKTLQVLLINPKKEEEKGEEEERLFCIANNVESTRMINKYTDYPLQSLKIDVILKRMCGKRIFFNVYHKLISIVLSRN